MTADFASYPSAADRRLPMTRRTRGIRRMSIGRDVLIDGGRA